MRPRRARLPVAATLLLAVCQVAPALVLKGKRFDPPLVFLKHASLEKSGATSAIKGQATVLPVYMSSVDNSDRKYRPEGFTIALFLPAYCELLETVYFDRPDEYNVTPVRWEGKAYNRIEKKDTKRIQWKCFDRTEGTTSLGFWFRIDPEAATTDGDRIKIVLYHDGQECSSDVSEFKVYEALPDPSPVPADRFKLFLHPSAYHRPGHYDELGDYLRKAGINAINVTVSPGDHFLEYVREMRKRGFYMIIPRAGSYTAPIWEIDGIPWFEEKDAGAMDTYLPHADAVLWDYERGGPSLYFKDDVIKRFAAEQGIAAEGLKKDAILTRHYDAWYAFIQRHAAKPVAYWSEFCRRINPDIERIVVQGSTHYFGPWRFLDYAYYNDHTDYHCPMFYNDHRAVRNMRKWMKRVPAGAFMGCHNLTHMSRNPVSAQTTMQQILSMALIGGTGFMMHPGECLDAEDFVLFNRVMNFMGTQRELLFDGVASPEDMKLDLLPKKKSVVDFGDGETITDLYPRWDEWAVANTYAADGKYLAVVNSYHRTEPCYARLTLAQFGADKALLLDEENREVLTWGGERAIPASVLKDGALVKCPPADYRGWQIAAPSEAVLARAAGFRPSALEAVRDEYAAYAVPDERLDTATSQAAVQLGYDDVDGDGQFEYAVESDAHKVWVSRAGTIVKWRVGAAEIKGKDMGIARDMIWLPAGERANGGMDSVMELKEKRAFADRVELVLSKVVPFDTVHAAIRLTKTMVFRRDPAIEVSVDIENVSDVGAHLDLSYRVHNYVSYAGIKQPVYWFYDGAELIQSDDLATFSVANRNLSEAEGREIFRGGGRYKVKGPVPLMASGEYYADKGFLLEFHYAEPAELLQLLRWGSAGTWAGTAEWVYRSRPIDISKVRRHAYTIRARAGVTELTADAVKAPGPHAAREAREELLLHVPFDGSCEPAVARGRPDTVVKGDPVYEEGVKGQAVRIEGVSVAYYPKGNITPQRGRIAFYFKPLWRGADERTHYFLRLDLAKGLLYFAKLGHGGRKLLLNLFDEDHEQHYPVFAGGILQPNKWYHMAARWDADRGEIDLFLDKQLVAAARHRPWKMGDFRDPGNEGMLEIEPSAEAVIDELKIWGVPDGE